MKIKNALCGISIALALHLGMLASSAQTNIYLFTGYETNITLAAGTYNITAYGAGGGGGGTGTGGLGAEMAGQFNFSTTTNLTLLVGGGGGGYYGGGGGGGGYSGDGSNGNGNGGGSFLSGGNVVGDGGYGGGGGAANGGGGGGGYSGGGGGGGGGGNGGGSIIDSSATTNLAEVSGIASPDDSPNGEIIITTVAVTAPPVPFTYTTNSGAITITGYTGSGGNVTIPATINGYPVTSIGFQAFFYSTNLTSVTIPNSVTSIGDYAFADCFSLTNITVITGNPNYSSLNGVLFNLNQTTLVEFPVGLRGSYTVPDSVTSIGSQAFYIDNNLTNIIIPSSVTSIGGEAFELCPSLTSFYFQGNAPSLGNEVFDSVPATVYYYYGTSGWSSMYGGLPTVELDAPIPPALGMSTYGGQPAVFFPTATGTNYVLQMTTNLTAPINWVTVTNGIPISGIIISNPSAAAFFRLH